MAILVTGGAGFIGANFVLDWLATSDEPVVTLDALTYAGNLGNLAALNGDPRYTLRAWLDQRRRAGRAPARARTSLDADRQLRRREPCRPLDRRARRRSSRPTSSAPSRCSRRRARYWRGLDAGGASGVPLPPRLDRRGLRLARRRTSRPSPRPTPYEPNSPYSASKAASDHLVRAWHETYGLPALITNCSNNYGPYQFPEKLIPLMIHNALAGKPLPVYGDGQQVRDWLYRRGPLLGAARACSSAAQPGETYNVGGNTETHQPRGGRAPSARCSTGMRPRADGSPMREQITFVTDRPGHDRRYAIDAAQDRARARLARRRETFETGHREDRALVSRQRRLGGATSPAAPIASWVARQYAMRILVLGRDGQVGTALHAPSLAPLGEIVALGRAERRPRRDAADAARDAGRAATRRT